MKHLNYILAVLLTVLWVIGFFTHVAGYAIHFLLIGALALILANVVLYDKKNTRRKHINNNN
ncbi:MAG: DUF5670 family protein [Bacteroidota bacterium]